MWTYYQDMKIIRMHHILAAKALRRRLIASAAPESAIAVMDARIAALESPSWRQS